MEGPSDDGNLLVDSNSNLIRKYITTQAMKQGWYFLFKDFVIIRYQ